MGLQWLEEGFRLMIGQRYKTMTISANDLRNGNSSFSSRVSKNLEANTETGRNALSFTKNPRLDHKGGHAIGFFGNVCATCHNMDFFKVELANQRMPSHMHGDNFCRKARELASCSFPGKGQ